MMTRVPHVGARAKICCGCMRISVAESIGMHETIAFGKWSMFDRTFAFLSRGASGKPYRMVAQSLACNTMHQSGAIRLKREAR